VVRRRPHYLPAPVQRDEDAKVAKDEHGQREDGRHDQVGPDLVVVRVEEGLRPGLA
jgi:hypothetical protein